MKRLLMLLAIISLTGCSTIKQYWPKKHDPVMFSQLVAVDLAIKHVDCNKPDWTEARRIAEQLSQYTEWRNDPQTVNIKGLFVFTERAGKSNSKAFCELGKQTASQRIQAAKLAWEGR